MLDKSPATKYINPRQDLIVIVDDDTIYLSALRRHLELAGFVNIKLVADPSTAETLVVLSKPDLLLVDLHFEGLELDGISLLDRIRKQGYEGLAVVVSGVRSPARYFRAARVGASDFLVKGPHLDLAVEVDRILSGERGNFASWTRQTAITELGFLRSFGLSEREINILSKFSEDFPRMNVLATRLGQSEPQLRKIFSRIYSKLEVENLYQLTHIISVCEMFDQQN